MFIILLASFYFVTPCLLLLLLLEKLHLPQPLPATLVQLLSVPTLQPPFQSLLLFLCLLPLSFAALTLFVSGSTITLYVTISVLTSILFGLLACLSKFFSSLSVYLLSQSASSNQRKTRFQLSDTSATVSFPSTPSSSSSTGLNPARDQQWCPGCTMKSSDHSLHLRRTMRGPLEVLQFHQGCKLISEQDS